MSYDFKDWDEEAAGNAANIYKVKRFQHNPSAVREGLSGVVLPPGAPTSSNTFQVTADTPDLGDKVLYDSSLPTGLGNDNFFLLKSGSDLTDSHCIELREALSGENYFRRFAVALADPRSYPSGPVAVANGQKVEVFDPAGLLQVGNTYSYRAGYSIDRSQKYGHAHDGIDSVMTTLWRRPFKCSGGSMIESENQVEIFDWSVYLTWYNATYGVNPPQVNNLLDLRAACGNANKVSLVLLRVAGLNGACGIKNYNARTRAGLDYCDIVDTVAPGSAAYYNSCGGSSGSPPIWPNTPSNDAGHYASLIFSNVNMGTGGANPDDWYYDASTNRYFYSSYDIIMKIKDPYTPRLWLDVSSLSVTMKIFLVGWRIDE